MPEPVMKHLPASLAVCLLAFALASSMAWAQSAKPASASRPAPARTAPAHTSRAAGSPHPARQATSREASSEAHRVAEPEHRVESEQRDDFEPEDEGAPIRFEPEQTSPDADRPSETSDSTLTTASRNGSSSSTRVDPGARLSANNGYDSSAAYSGTTGPTGARRSMELDSAEAHSVVRHLNTERATLSGINKAPIPSGRVMNGGNIVTVRTGDGRIYFLRADGTLVRFQSGMLPPDRAAVSSGPASASTRPAARISTGTFATFRHDGTLASQRVSGPNGLSIQHGAHGERVIIAHRPDHSTLVSTGPHSGYLERTIEQNGRTLIQRTYISGSRSWQRNYAKFNGRFTSMQANGPAPKLYVPRYHYAPAFYGWAGQGWAYPINSRWNWASRHWFVYYGSYFYPWSSYSDGSFWLTDYILGQTLSDDYDMQPENGSVPADASSDANGDNADLGQQSGDETVYAPFATAIPSEVKQEIAAEVHQQLMQESMASEDSSSAQAEAPDDPAQFLQAGQIFIVSTPLNVRIDAAYSPALPFGFQQCNLSPGDVLRLTRIPDYPSAMASNDATGPAIPSFASLEVVASQRGDCPAGVQVGVQTIALQEMENNFQAQLDDGLQMLHSQQGKDGLPAEPPSTLVEQPAATDLPPATANVGVLLQGLLAQANRAEAQIGQTVMSAPTVSN